MTDDRTNPPYVADERAMLNTWLDFHRATLLVKCEGVGDDRLAERSVPPSSMSLLGLVRHMAEVERNWFRRVMAAEHAPPLYYSDADPDGDFDLLDGSDPAEAFKAWQAECQHAREVTAAAGSLDALGKAERRGEPVSLRWILVHMIEEYARHNGHADLLRECIDGATGD